MSIASPTYLCLATGCDWRKLERESSMSGKRRQAAKRPGRAAVIASRAWSSLDWLNRRPEWIRNIGGAGSLRRRTGGWDGEEIRTPSHLVSPAPARRGWQRVERGTYTRRSCVAGNAGSPKLAGNTRPIWRRSPHSIQRGPVTGFAAGIQPGPSHRHKQSAMTANPGEVGEKGGSSWCGRPTPGGG